MTLSRGDDSQLATLPVLRDARGQVNIGPYRNSLEQQLFSHGATSIVTDRATKALVGVYVDNETPNRDAVAREMLVMRAGQVVVGLYPSEVGYRIPGCVCALEWYPYHQHWGAPPKAEAYILQHDFAWPGDTPPTAFQRHLLRAQVAWRRPKLVWWF